MKYVLDAHGESALVCHNERLADPLDPVARAISVVAKKRAKTEADHYDIARLEFFGGLYMTAPLQIVEGTGSPRNPAGWRVETHPDSVPGLPAWNVLRCLQDGAKRHKRGVDVLRGIQPISEFAPLVYEGPTNPQEMWESGTFSLRKTVGVQRARTVRTRPMFVDWSFRLEVEVDPTVFDTDAIEKCWSDAGRYAGLGEMRPVYGRFAGTVVAL